MKNTNKTVMAALLIGLGAGLAKLGQKHQKDIKRVANNVKNKAEHSQIGQVSVKSFQLNNAYNRLTEGQRRYVNQTVRIILPHSISLSAFMYQEHAVQYLRILHYASVRDELHSKHASMVLDIPLHRSKQLTIAMSRQGILDHTGYETNYVRKNKAQFTLSHLKDLFSKGGLVAPAVFTTALRNLTAYVTYNLN